MKTVKILFSIAILLAFISCGSNGELSVFDLPELEVSSQPNFPASSEGTPQAPACPVCETEECCCENTEPPVVDEPEVALEDLEDTEEPKNELPTLEAFSFRIGPPVFPVPRDEKKLYCMEVLEKPAVWWLAYQLTGGLIAYVNLEMSEPQSINTPEGRAVHYSATLIETPETVVLELDYFIGYPQAYYESVSITPYNITLKYHDLAYRDPVFGNVFVDGEVICEGKKMYNPISGHNHEKFGCTGTGYENDSILFAAGLQENFVMLDIKKIFDGREDLLENYTFTGNITIDYGEDEKSFEMTNEKVSSNVLACF